MTRMSWSAMRAEAGELEGHRVGADRQLGHAVGAGFRRHGHARLNQRGTGDRHGRAWQYGARRVGRPSVDFTGLLLRHSGRRTQKQAPAPTRQAFSTSFPILQYAGDHPQRRSLHRPSRHYRQVGPTTEVHVPKSSNCATGHGAKGPGSDEIRPESVKSKGRKLPKSGTNSIY